MPTVLIVTKSNDNHSPALVAEALAARGARAFRLDTDRFPTEVRLALHQPRGPSVLRDGDAAVALANVTAVWYRRAAFAAALPADMDPQERAASVQESRASLLGTIEALPCFMLDRPSTVRHADHKPLQLAIASELGLDIPRTLTTNDPAEVRAFWAACDGRVVAKMLTSFAIYDEAGREQVVFTSEVSAAQLDDLDGLALSPMTFQEHLAKARELRVTVIGGRVFAAAVDSQAMARARVDWRKEGAALVGTWTPYELPDDIATRLVDLAARLGLGYGAADLIVTPDGRHILLEINPGGEWFWLDNVWGPRTLSSAIADTLLAGA